MRNPIRLKNLRARFWPVYLAGLVAVASASPSFTSIALGLPLVGVGVGVRSWGAGHLVKNDLLICSGPYAFVRHPFYFGTLCIGSGFAIALGGWAAIASLGVLLAWFFVGYFPRKEQVEADRLHALHGVEYDRYREAVPALWPSWRRHRVGAEADGDEAHAARWSLARYDANNELGTLIACLAGVAVLVGWVSLHA